MEKYYRTIIIYEVLSEDLHFFSNIVQTAHNVTEGDCSGMELNTISEELNV